VSAGKNKTQNFLKQMTTIDIDLLLFLLFFDFLVEARLSEEDDLDRPI
jgi:hypothetical protein